MRTDETPEFYEQFSDDPILLEKMKKEFWKNRFLNSGAVVNRKFIRKMYRVVAPVKKTPVESESTEGEEAPEQEEQEGTSRDEA